MKNASHAHGTGFFSVFIWESPPPPGKRTLQLARIPDIIFFISQILLMSAFVIISLYKSYFSSTADANVPRPDHMERLSLFLISAITLWLFVSLVFVFSLSTVSDRIGKVWNVLVSDFFQPQTTFICYCICNIFLHNQFSQEPDDSTNLGLTDSLSLLASSYIFKITFSWKMFLE